MNNQVELRAEKKELNFPLKALYFYLTEGCNLACRHCWLSPKLQYGQNVFPALSIELFRSIIEQAIPLGMTWIKLTGGEPLMHPEILEVFRIIKEKNLGVSIETNGVLCTLELAVEIASLNKPSVAVSLDGINAQTHESIRGIKGCFDATLEGIKNLVQVGLKPQIIFTIMEYNKDQLEPFIRMVESLGAGSIKFNIVQPTGRGEKLSSSGNYKYIKELIELGHWIDNVMSKSTKIKLYFDYPPAFRSLRKMYNKNGDGCSACGILSILGVLSNGAYALCGIGVQVEDLIFGNSLRDNLSDIWENNKTLIELREGIPSRFKGICGKCHMRKICLSSCVAQNYYQSNSMWEPFWFCEQAYQNGFFPRSRILPV